MRPRELVLEPLSLIGPFLEDVSNETTFFRRPEDAKRVTKQMQS